MKISNSEKIKLVMAKDWWETEDLGGKLGKVKVSDGPVGLRCLAVTDSWANDSIYPSVDRPLRELKAFQKVFVKAGKKVTVKLQLDKDAFTYFDEQTHGWRAENGEISLQICKHANEVLLQCSFRGPMN